MNPQRPDCAYPEKGLCGTGLAYKLCQLLGAATRRSTEELVGYLDLVALATVADLVPLTGENRVLVSHGLRRFGRSRLAGVDALLAACGAPADGLTAGKIGFVVAPRINAAGRMGEASDALRLLLTDDESEARSLAEQLEDTNERRREEDRRTLDEALGQITARYDPATDFGVVLAAEGWHPGVIGIVASRVVERIHRPVLVIALDGGRGRGSGRSIPGFDLYEALCECSQHLRRFGGHRQAAGMDLGREAVPALREAFNAAARARLEPSDLRPRLRPDAELRLDQVDLELAHWLGYLGPHGIGNPGPLFVSRGVAVERSRIVGEGHLKAVLAEGGNRLDAIGFGLADRYPPPALAAGRHDVLYRLEKNEWRGVSRPQARLTGFRPATSAE